MSARPDISGDELGGLSNAALMRLLDIAQDDERTISERPRAVHEQLDGLPRPGQGSLDALQDEERMLSERRLQLHQRITELRMERARRVNGLRAVLRVVE